MAVLRAALLLLLFAAPASAGGGYGFGGEWTAPEISLTLTEEGDRVNGELSVGEPPDNRLTLSARINTKLKRRQFKGTLWRNGTTVDVYGSFRDETLQLRVRFVDKSTRYYYLRPKLVPFRLLFIPETDRVPLTLVLERRRANGSATGWIAHKRARTRLTSVSFKSGISGRLADGGTFRLSRPLNPESHPKGAMTLNWPGGDVLLVPLSELESAYKGRTKEYRQPQGWFRCTLPTGWSEKPTEESQVRFEMAATGGMVLVAWEELEPNERSKSVRALLKASQATLPAEALGELQLQLKGSPRYQDVEIDGRPAAIARWVGTRGGKRYRVWTAMLTKGGIKVEALMLCERRFASSCEAQVALMAKTLKILKLRSPRKR